MPISRKKLIQRFRELGFSGPMSGGRHQFMINGELKVRIPNPHKGSDISDSLLNEILRQAGIERIVWEKG
jgi:predicted RNA binding protein YcfA (HicA-like mRNA interferase family)